METHPFGMPLEPVNEGHLRHALAEFNECMRQLRDAPLVYETQASRQALLAASVMAQQLAAYLEGTA